MILIIEVGYVIKLLKVKLKNMYNFIFCLKVSISVLDFIGVTEVQFI